MTAQLLSSLSNGLLYRVYPTLSKRVSRVDDVSERDRPPAAKFGAREIRGACNQSLHRHLDPA